MVADNAKLYVNYKEGFIGSGLKKDEFICDCSDIDDIIAIRKNGAYIVTKIAEKVFVGTDIMYANVFLKNDDRTIYNVVYQDGKDGQMFAKRCAISGLTRDREYNLTKGTPGSKIIYLSVNPNGEAEVVKALLKPKAHLKKTSFEFDFGQLAVKGRATVGNVLTKHAVHKITLKEKGLSTLGGRKIWFDDSVFRLNADGRGLFLGEFGADDKIQVITKNGFFRITNSDLSNHFEENILLIEKYVQGKVYSVVYWDAEQKFYYVKRFTIEETEKPQCFISEDSGSKLISITEVEYPRFEISFGGQHKSRENEIIEVAEFIGIKGYKAKGKRLSNFMVNNIQEIEPVVKKETSPSLTNNVEEKPPANQPLSDTDAAQMKLEL